MSKEQIASLDTDRLWAIVRSTSASGSFWLELTYAKDELARRYAVKGHRLIGL